jgi:hypothetical protein
MLGTNSKAQNYNFNCLLSLLSSCASCSPPIVVYPLALSLRKLFFNHSISILQKQDASSPTSISTAASSSAATAQVEPPRPAQMAQVQFALAPGRANDAAVLDYTPTEGIKKLYNKATFSFRNQVRPRHHRSSSRTITEKGVLSDEISYLGHSLKASRHIIGSSRQRARLVFIMIAVGRGTILLNKSV